MFMLFSTIVTFSTCIFPLSAERVTSLWLAWVNVNSVFSGTRIW